MLSSVLGFLAAPGFGLVTGLFGAWITKREERKQQEIDNAHEEKMAEIDAIEANAERVHSLAMADKQLQVTETEGEIALDIAEMGNAGLAIAALARPSGIPYVDAALRFVRPLITVYLLAVVSYFGYLPYDLIGGLEALPTAELVGLFVYLIEALIVLATTATGWWFGSRGMKRGR